MATAQTTLPLKPHFLQATGADPVIEYSATDLRRFTGSMWPKPGTIAYSFSAEAITSPNWTFKLTPGMAVLGPADTDPTCYRFLVHNDDPNLTVDLSGFNLAPVAQRTHKIWLTIYETSPNYFARVEVTEDTGAGAPTPAGLYPLQIGTVRIGPSQANIQNSHITNLCEHADTGWSANITALGPNAVDGNATLSTMPLRLTMRGRSRFMGGALKRNTGTWISGDVLFTMPYYMRDHVYTRRMIVAGDQQPGVINMYPNGAVTYVTYSLTGAPQNTVVYFDGLTWDV